MVNGSSPTLSFPIHISRVFMEVPSGGAIVRPDAVSVAASIPTATQVPWEIQLSNVSFTVPVRDSSDPTSINISHIQFTLPDNVLEIGGVSTAVTIPTPFAGGTEDASPSPEPPFIPAVIPDEWQADTSTTLEMEEGDVVAVYADIPAPSVVAGNVPPSPPAVSVFASIPPPDILSGFSASVLPATVFIPTPIVAISGDTRPTPSPLHLPTFIPAPTISIDSPSARPTPSSLSLSAVIPTPNVIAPRPVVVTPSTISVTTTIPSRVIPTPNVDYSFSTPYTRWVFSSPRTRL